MKRFFLASLTILVMISFAARADEKEYGIGLKAGVSIPPQDLDDGALTHVVGLESFNMNNFHVLGGLRFFF